LVKEVAATASEGDTMAPKRNAAGQGIPGIIIRVAKATAAVVKKTNPIEAKLIGRMAALKSRQLVFHAASYNNGGKKIRKIISGFKEMTGRPGIRLITIPDKSRTIGRGKLNLLLSTPKNATPNNNITMISTFSML